MRKINPAELLETLDADEIKAYYRNHSVQDCAEYFHISTTAFIRVRDYLGIKKTPQDKQETRKRYCLEHYGVESPMQLESISKKMSQKIDYKEVVRKSKETSLKKYGVDSFSKTDGFKDVIHNIYEDDERVQSINDKRQQTCLEKYGAKTIFESAEFQEKIKQTNNEKYGCDYYMQTKEFRDKTQYFMQENYGVDHYCQTDEFVEKTHQTCLERYGVDSFSKTDEFLEKTRATNNEKYGVDWYVQTQEYSDKYRNTVQERYGVDHYSQTDEFLDKFRTTCQERLGVDYPAQNREVHKKALDNKNVVAVSCDGTHLDSVWECEVYDFCKRNNIEISAGPTIEFEYKGAKHVTHIDFNIDGILFEVKGSHLLNGCWDDKQLVPIDVKLDIYRKNHVVVITENSDIFGKPNSDVSNGLNYPEKCKYPLIGVDIDLFRDNPVFPYDDKKPRCFYDVKVNNQKSSHEAFYDESIRWKMIKNRINYTGGFINGKQILTALNVTRTCKQPSWFSKTFAEYIINKYVTTDIVVDPFAGWGTRCDATIALGKTYIGVDLNDELVKWHIEHERNISLGDAESFTYDGECSVFICPPYQDVETYFEGQDIQTTQCQWLQKVMRNVPNAKEYIMVCKVVDEGWEKYIVEIKTNKSHFGINNEYILVIKNES